MVVSGAGRIPRAGRWNPPERKAPIKSGAVHKAQSRTFGLRPCRTLRSTTGHLRSRSPKPSDRNFHPSLQSRWSDRSFGPCCLQPPPCSPPGIDPAPPSHRAAVLPQTTADRESRLVPPGAPRNNTLPFTPSLPAPDAGCSGTPRIRRIQSDPRSDPGSSGIARCIGDTQHRPAA